MRSPNHKLIPIPTLSNWVSPQLGIRFDWQPHQPLTLYTPNGDRFLSPLELDTQNRHLTHRAETAERQAENTKSQLKEGARRLIALGMPIAQIAEVLSLPIEALRNLE
jgi:hypothetical protein